MAHPLDRRRWQTSGAVLHDYKAAAHALRSREVEAEEIRRGLRSPAPRTGPSASCAIIGWRSASRKRSEIPHRSNRSC